MLPNSWTWIFQMEKVSICLVRPYVGRCTSGWKVPKIRSHRMRMLPKFLSRYSGSLPWCTRWCEGVTKTYSNQRGSFPIFSVCAKSPYTRWAECIVKTSAGCTPSSGSGSQIIFSNHWAHLRRSAVERLKYWLEWCTWWPAQMSRMPCAARWYQ